MDKSLLALLVCPKCQGALSYRADDSELVCKADRLAYPVRDDVPVMLIAEARVIEEDEA